MDGIHGVLDSDTAEVPCRHFHAQREVQVDPLDRGLGEVQLEDVLVLNRVRGSVDLPVRGAG